MRQSEANIHKGECYVHGSKWLDISRKYCMICRVSELEDAARWVVNDAMYKAPEQVTEECRRWVERLRDVV